MSPADVFVHVGPHKTGTTFVQEVLSHNQSALAADGALFPGRPYMNQRLAVLRLLRGRWSRSGRGPLPRRWNDLAAEVRSWPGRVAIISVEHLDSATSQVMRAVVESFAPARVHVVYTVRDFTQVVPAMWQTQTRNGSSEGWHEYISKVRATQDTSSWPYHLSGHDPRIVLTAWEEHVPPERIHVITVPRPGADPSVLWQRFCSVVGLKAGRYSLDVPRDNKSLGLAEIQFLQRLNSAGAGQVSDDTYRDWVHRFISRGILESRANQQEFALGGEDFEWVRDHACRFVDHLRSGRYPVTGDLEEIMPPKAAPRLPPPGSADDSEVLDIAVEVAAGLLAAVDGQSGPANRVAAGLTGRVKAGVRRTGLCRVIRRARTSFRLKRSLVRGRRL